MAIEKEILESYGIEIPEQIENPDEFKQTVLSTITEKTESRLLNNPEFYEGLDPEKLPEEWGNKKFNEARKMSNAKLIASIKKETGIELSEEEVKELKDSDQIFSHAYGKLKGLSKEEYVKVANDWQQKAQDLERELKEKEDNFESKLTEALKEKEPTIRQSILNEIASGQAIKQKELELINSIDEDENIPHSFIKGLNLDMLRESGFNAMKTQYDIVENDKGKFELRLKSKPEFQPTKRDSSEFLTPKDFLISHFKSVGVFAANNPDTKTEPQKIKINVSPEDSKEKVAAMINAEMESMDNKLDG